MCDVALFMNCRCGMETPKNPEPQNPSTLNPKPYTINPHPNHL
jgi:hypothetical protein